MSVEIIEIAGGKMAALKRADYEQLLALAEDRIDVLAASAAEGRRVAGEEYVPAHGVDRMLAEKKAPQD